MKTILTLTFLVSLQLVLAGPEPRRRYSSSSYSSSKWDEYQFNRRFTDLNLRFTNLNKSATSSPTTTPTQGIILVGGNGNSAMQTAELWYHDDTTYTSCNLPQLPERRYHGTLNGYKYCCGGENEASWTSCIEMGQEGSWATSNSNLTPRWYDVSWATANGIYLMGGESENNGQWTLDQAKTVTLVKPDGSSSPGEFSMESMTVGACAIPDGDSVVIVGGQFTSTDVSRYNEDGFVEALPSVDTKGGGQSCAGYINNQNKMVYFVMGGVNSEGADYSAHTLVKGDSQWKSIAPNGWQESWPVYDQIAITINSKIYFFGGRNGPQYFDIVIMFDTETETWSEAGVMKVPRGKPGGSVVSLEEVIEYATDCETKELPLPDVVDPVVLITGGNRKSAEIFNPATNPDCSLPQLPEVRSGHSQDGGLTCGGSDPSALNTCVKWNPASGSWDQTPFTLKESRVNHVSWETPTGVYLFGGDYSPKTSEKVTADSSVLSFNLKYDTRQACAIPDQENEEVIITGGTAADVRQIVSVYSDAGWKKDLAPMNVGRALHACGFYVSGGKKVFLVSGGITIYNGNPGIRIDSTEIYSDDTWTILETGKLPKTMWGMGSTSFNNKVLVFGGFDGSDENKILEFNPETGEWSVVGNMKETRRHDRVSVVSFVDYKNWCN